MCSSCGVIGLRHSAVASSAPLPPLCSCALRPDAAVLTPSNLMSFVSSVNPEAAEAAPAFEGATDEEIIRTLRAQFAEKDRQFAATN